MTAQGRRAGVPADVRTASSAPIACSGSLITLCVALCGLWLTVAQAETKTHFDIAAGPAAKSLDLYAKQAGVQLGFDVNAVNGIRTNSVKGAYEPLYALKLLLKGTELEAELGNNGIAIRRTTKVAKAHEATQSQFPVAEQVGPHAPASRNVEIDASRQKARPLEEIIVTGSNIPGSPSIAATSITFDREDLAATGFTTVADLFESLPQNLDEITEVGALATGASSLASANSPGAQGINLRGLGPGSTLVLYNGKRRPGNINGRVVDISAVPLAMIDRIDIVTGGHSAIYGSDAVAGVVNIVTRSEFDGAATQAYYGRSSHGGRRLTVSHTFGQEFDAGGYVIGYDFRDDQPLDAAATGVLRPPSPQGLTPIPGRFNLRGANRQHLGMLAGHVDVNDKVSLYGDAQLAVDEYERQFAYRVAGCCALDLIRITDGEQYSAVAGLKLSLTDNWTLDASILHGVVENTADDGEFLSFEPGGIASGSPPPVPTERDYDKATLSSLSLLVDGPITNVGSHIMSAAFGIDLRGESFLRTEEQLATGATETFENDDRDVFSAFGEVQLPLDIGNSRRLDLSVAGRYDRYSDFSSRFTPQFGIAFEPVNGLSLRGTYAKAFRAPSLFELNFGTSVRVRTLVDPLDPSGQTPATVFIEVGGNPDLQPEHAETAAFGIHWEPSDHTAWSLSYFDIKYDGRIAKPEEEAGGLTALEREDRYPGLIDRNPTPDRLNDILTRASVILNDSGQAFDPEADDPFAIFSNIIVFDNRSNNVAVEKARGFDVQASTNWETRSGTWGISLNGAYYLDFTRKITTASPAINQLNQPGKAVDLRLRGHIGWSKAVWNAQLYMNYVDAYEDTTTSPPGSIDSWTTIDLSLGFNGSAATDNGYLDGLEVTLGAMNLFNANPPVFENNVLALGYDAVNANALGRYIFFRLAKRW